MAAVERNQPATMQDTNEAIKDAVEVEISSTDSCSTNQFFILCHYGLHTKNLVVVIPAWFFASLTLFLRVSKFTFGVWQSTSRGVVRASCVPSTTKKKKKCENFFWRVWRYFCKICTIKNFQLYGTTFLLFWANMPMGAYWLSKKKLGLSACQRMWLKTPVADNNRFYLLYWTCRMRKSLPLLCV